jgi:16S rRNA (uracil1498-N3)-methyltransferase
MHRGACAAPTLGIALWEGEHQRSLSQVLQSACAGAPPPRALLLVIGPEGGFDPSEVKALRAQGAITAGLGRRVLRSETAAVLATGLALSLAGELG